MANVGWNESSPPDTESAGLGDDRIRSLMASVRIGLDDEHNWPSAGGDAGKHRLGSTRAYYGPQSAVSSAGTDGKLMVTSDTSRLFGVGSGGTSYFGGPAVISAGEFPAVSTPQRAIWVEEFGFDVTLSAGTQSVVFPRSGFSGMPFTCLTLYNRPGSQLSANYVLSVQTVNGLSFMAWAVEGSTGNMASGVPFFWRSIGTRAL